MMRRYIPFSLWITGLLLLTASTATAGLPGPDYLIYGIPMDADTILSSGTLSLVLEGQSEAIASYVLGSDPTLGPQFLLRIPMDYPGERTEGRAQEGDVGSLYINDQPAGTLSIGSPGGVQHFDADLNSNRAQPALSISDVSVMESDSAPVSAYFVVSLSRAISTKVRVDWVTADVEAVGGSSCGAGIDYIRSAGVATINPGDQSTEIIITVCPDEDAENEEHFTLSLSSPDGAGLLDPEGLGSILDDDTPPRVSIADTSVQQPTGGEAAATFSIRLDHAWEEEVRVDYLTRDGEAYAGVEYLAAAGTVVFPAGDTEESIDISVSSSSPFRGERNFFVDLSSPQNATVDRATGEGIILGSRQLLRFLEAVRAENAGVNDSDGAFAVALSPDGAQLYALGRSRDRLLVFNRNSSDGSLSLLESYGAEDYGSETAVSGLAGPEDLILSPDGKTLYVAGFEDDAVAVFARNDDPADPDFGKLSFVESEVNGVNDPADEGPKVEGLAGPTALAISPDGTTLYVGGFSSSSIAVFRIDGATGALSFEEAEIDGVDDAGDFGGAVDGLAGISDVLVSPDGLSVYGVGTAENAVAVFERKTDDSTGALGHLSFMQVQRQDVGGVNGMEGAISATISPDGGQLYVCAFYSDAVQIFDRAADGRLTPRSSVVRDELDRAVRIRTSRDGNYLFVLAGDDSLVVLRRYGDQSLPIWGTIRMLELHRDGIAGTDGLWGPLGLAVSPDDSSVYVASYLDAAISTFSRDLSAPEGLVVTSTSHLENSWSNNPVITMSWSGAVDGALGSGVEGYSFVMDQQPVTEVDSSFEMEQGSDPHIWSSPTLSDGAWYFHIRACDAAGNCGAIVDAGPYLIDITPPSGPSDLVSTSHIVGVPNDANIISMQWIAAADGVSGLAGLAGAFDQNSNPVCPGSINLPPAAVQTSSAVLPDGSWYFHICAFDAAGNQGVALVAGPYVVGADETPPQVEVLSAVAAPPGGGIDPATANETMITRLVLHFSEPMNQANGSLLDPASYRVVSAGENGEIESSNCALIGGDDELRPIAGVIWDGSVREAALELGSSLEEGSWIVMACAASGLSDAAGNVLDGNGDGVAGDDWVFTFSQTWTGLLLNPNFDEGIESWAFSDVSLMSALDDDVDGRTAFSGALLMTKELSGESSLAISQCRPVEEYQGWPWLMRGRVRIAETTPPDAPSSRAWGELSFFDSSDCSASAMGPARSTSLASGDTGQSWAEMDASGERVPIGARSALISWRYETPEGRDEAATAAFDALVFGVADPGPVLISASDTSIDEGDSASAPVLFEISLSHPSPQPVSLDLWTEDETARAGRDYLAASGNLSFLPGELLKSFPVQIFGDSLDEPDESFSLLLSSASGGNLETDRVRATILDDDPMVTVEGLDLSSCEAAPMVTLVFQLNAPSAWEVSFDWQTRDRTAMAGEDYVGSSGHLVIQPGRTRAEASVSLIDDGLQEGDEFFEIDLSNVSNAVPGRPALVTITDNDPSMLPGDAWPDCVLDGRDISEILRAISDPSYLPPGNADCDGSGGAIDERDLECLLGAIYAH